MEFDDDYDSLIPEEKSPSPNCGLKLKRLKKGTGSKKSETLQDFTDADDEPALVVHKLKPHAPTGHGEEQGDDVDSRVGVGEGGGKGSGVQVRVRKVMLSMRRGKKREMMVRRVGLGLRVFEFVTCLVSFSVMAADRGRGWALDSFDRYLEFRYCISANILGFAFS
ncbi:hypothetical protein Droror1_Dr00018238 [Drosera rotundifolia]